MAKPAPSKSLDRMNLEHIAGMVRLLQPLLTDKEKARLVLEKYWSNKLVVVWTTEDFHRAANERGLALTRKEAQELLDDLKIHYDRQYGFKWTDLWTSIDNSGFGRNISKDEARHFVST